MRRRKRRRRRRRIRKRRGRRRRKRRRRIRRRRRRRKRRRRRRSNKNPHQLYNQSIQELFFQFKLPSVGYAVFRFSLWQWFHREVRQNYIFMTCNQCIPVKT